MLNFTNILKNDTNTTVIPREQSAAMKGLLICLVVLGHNVFFINVFPYGTWNWLYTFHVSSFFILPFFYPAHEFSWSHIWTNMKRLLWPYSYMFVSLFLVNCFMSEEKLVDLGLFNTFITGDRFQLDKYIGIQYLWFLPAMFSMLVIKDVYSSVGLITRKIILTFGVLFYFLSWVFFFNAPYSDYINHSLSKISVLSFMLGFSMFFLGYITNWLLNKYDSIRIVKWISIVILGFSLIAFCLTFRYPCFWNVQWISRAVCPIFGFFLLYVCRGYNCLILRKIGFISLPIYLFHQPLNHIICRALTLLNLPPIVNLVISYTFVLVLSYYIASFITSKKWLNKAFFAR